MSANYAKQCLDKNVFLEIYCFPGHFLLPGACWGSLPDLQHRTTLLQPIQQNKQNVAVTANCDGASCMDTLRVVLGRLADISSLRTAFHPTATPTPFLPTMPTPTTSREFSNGE